MAKTTPWNPPTSAMLAPGETRTYGVKFLVSDEIRNIEKTLAANSRPVAVGIPGYVLPMGLDGKLFLKYAHKDHRNHGGPAGRDHCQSGQTDEERLAGHDAAREDLGPRALDCHL